jgi:hypothetical protein
MIFDLAHQRSLRPKQGSNCSQRTFVGGQKNLEILKILGILVIATELAGLWQNGWK